MRIGIFFGGQSREREIAFAGGRTVYDNLDKELFEPIPIFVDSLGNFILLDWQYLYKGTIRDFYPPAAYQPKNFQIYVESLFSPSKEGLGVVSNSPLLSKEELGGLIAQVGKKIEPHEFKDLFDFAFLALHGSQGEDGAIQGLLEWYGIPYSGCGILPSAIGTNKAVQADLLAQYGFKRPKSLIIQKKDYLKNFYKGDILEWLVAKIGLPMVIKAPNQGSSIGIAILNEKDNHAFHQLICKAFFIEEISGRKWKNFSEQEHWAFITHITDIREGVGFPLELQIIAQNLDGTRVLLQDVGLVYHPEELWKLLDELLTENHYKAVMTALSHEESILIERFIIGKEFSCIVVEDENGEPVALPPTEILKKADFFDYRAKYLPGISRKITPIDLPIEQIEAIREECCRLFKAINADVYARIDGFINALGEIYLNDPNTTSGMLPSSFFFHQAAEIGLNPSQFLTYIIRTSLAARIKTPKNNYFLRQQLAALDTAIAQLHSNPTPKIKVAVIMGGYSSERHISVESGRNIYEKLASSGKYEPVPVFLTGNDQNHELYLIPINIMLKDNADDIREKAQEHKQETENPKQEILEKIRQEAKAITQKYAQNAIFTPQKISYQDLKNLVDEVFIALHGRPGEDGALQQKLLEVGLPFNGSGVESSKITINKYETNEILARNGILVAKHYLVFKDKWFENQSKELEFLEKEFGYPLIAKPADDGCSSAVKKIKNREELLAYAEMSFRESDAFLPTASQTLKLKVGEEFPKRSYFLVEELIEKKGAVHFLEITGGMLTTRKADGSRNYQVFEPSETLAVGEVLSLEEKFLAGEGQNITPARFAKTPEENQRISAEVRKTLQKTAEILNVEGYCRIDAFVRVYADGQVETIIIEVNSLPGMTPATCIFHQAALENYKPYEFVDKILEYGRGT
jgi:D-alanine-D-alanine ligase